jgi:Methyltransferase domain
VSQNNGAGFESLSWLFTCDSRNRGIIRQGFDEAALLWRAVKATSGNILEIGRNFGGSTVLLATAGAGREIYSIDLRSNEHRACKDYFLRPENERRIHLVVGDSRQPLANLRFGFEFIDGDHTFEGVLGDVLVHWNAAGGSEQFPALIAFHDALPNTNFSWRDKHRTLNRLWIRFKNHLRKRQKPVIAPAYAHGVFCVCQILIELGIAAEWGAAGSMFVLRKLKDLPADFSDTCRRLAPAIVANTDVL